MRGLRVTATLGLLALAGLAPAGAELVLTADTASRLALQGNRELRAARGMVAEAQARAKMSGRLENPELQAEIAGGAEFEGRVEVGFSQRFPLTARLRLERRLSALAVEMATLEVAIKERQLETAARTAFVELAAARQAGELAARQAGAAQTDSSATAAEAREGLASSLDEVRGLLAAQEIASQRATLRAEEAALSGELATFLGVPVETAFSIKDALTLPKSLPPLRSAAGRPELRLAALAVEAGDVDVSLAQASRWEDIALGVFVEGERQRDEPEGIEPEGLLGLRVSVPLPVWQNGNGRVAEKQTARARRQLDLETVRLAFHNEAVAAHRILAARHEAAQHLESKALPAARRLLAETTASHQRGEIARSETFRARERLSALENAALAARKNFHLARVRWLAAVGDFSSHP